MAYKNIIYRKENRIAYITINRPEVMNSIDPPTSCELSEAWRDFRDDPETWVAILTGTGERAFSAGNDLKYSANYTPAEMEKQQPAEGSFGGNTELECWKPMIAAVNGFALGGGLEIALACDIIIAAEHAKLGLPEPRVGYVPGSGGMHRLPRQLPLKVAMGMLLTGRHITAQEAYRIGLVNEVTPLGNLMSRAQSWAEEILECAPLQIRAVKQTAMLGLSAPLEIALRTKLPLLQEAQQADDWMEGPRAFNEKRKPEWKGR